MLVIGRGLTGDPDGTPCGMHGSASSGDQGAIALPDRRALGWLKWARETEGQCRRGRAPAESGPFGALYKRRGLTARLTPRSPAQAPDPQTGDDASVSI